jgi:hypothetical protein
MAMQARAWWAGFGALAALLCSGACSSTNDGTGPASGVDGSAAADDGGATCATLGLHVDSFSPGLMKQGSAGLFNFELVSSDPSPPNDPQMNTWIIRVLDKSGAPVTGATITLPVDDTALGFSAPKNPWMPTMNHGSSIVNTIVNNGDGTANVQIYFTMSGLWQTFVVAQSGSMTDSAMYSFCLP